jgi:5-methylcytosine-specific restriction endonuclease McrA
MMCGECNNIRLNGKANFPRDDRKKSPRKRGLTSKRPVSKYKQIYLDFFGYDETDRIPCELCSATAVDIHHIDARGMGGDPQKKKDVIENLMALCRKCHDKVEGNKEDKPVLRRIHLIKMKNAKLKR